MPAPQPRLKKRRVMLCGFMLGVMGVAFRGIVDQPVFADAVAASRGCQCNLHAVALPRPRVSELSPLLIREQSRAATGGYSHFGRVEDGRGNLGHAATLRFPSPLMTPRNGCHPDTIMEHVGCDPAGNVGIVHPPVYHTCSRHVSTVGSKTSPMAAYTVAPPSCVTNPRRRMPDIGLPPALAPPRVGLPVDSSKYADLSLRRPMPTLHAGSNA